VGVLVVAALWAHACSACWNAWTIGWVYRELRGGQRQHRLAQLRDVRTGECTLSCWGRPPGRTGRRTTPHTSMAWVTFVSALRCWAERRPCICCPLHPLATHLLTARLLSARSLAARLLSARLLMLELCSRLELRVLL